MLSVLMILLAAALPQRGASDILYARHHYAHRRLARLGLVQLMVPTRGGPGRASLRTRVSWRRDLLGSRLSPGAGLTNSERFRSAPRTCSSFCGNLSVQ